MYLSGIPDWPWQVIGGVAAVAAVLIALVSWLWPRSPKNRTSPVPPVAGNDVQKVFRSNTQISLLDEISENEIAVLSWSYHSEHPYLSFESGMGWNDYVSVGQRSLYPWNEDKGLEPESHKEIRTHWISIAESCIKKGFFRRQSGDLYKLTGEGMRLAKQFPEPRFPSEESLAEILSDFNQLTEGLSLMEQKLLLQIKREGGGRIAAFHEAKGEAISPDQKKLRPYVRLGGLILGEGTSNDRLKCYEAVWRLCIKGYIEPISHQRAMSDFYDVDEPEILQLSNKGRQTADLF